MRISSGHANFMNFGPALGNRLLMASSAFPKILILKILILMLSIEALPMFHPPALGKLPAC
jgi:hypothetical protein